MRRQCIPGPLLEGLGTRLPSYTDSVGTHCKRSRRRAIKIFFYEVPVTVFSETKKHDLT